MVDGGSPGRESGRGFFIGGCRKLLFGNPRVHAQVIMPVEATQSLYGLVRRLTLDQEVHDSNPCRQQPKGSGNVGNNGSGAVCPFLRHELTEATPRHSSMTHPATAAGGSLRRSFRAHPLGAQEDEARQVQEAGRGCLSHRRQRVDGALTHRLSGEAYRDYVKQLAKAADFARIGNEAALTRFDRKRKKRVSNDEFTHPHDSMRR